jgi:hypothetical protein
LEEGKSVVPRCALHSAFGRVEAPSAQLYGTAEAVRALKQDDRAVPVDFTNSVCLA